MRLLTIARRWAMAPVYLIGLVLVILGAWLMALADRVDATGRVR